MSKLATLIRRVSRLEPAPLGFASASRKPPPTMLLVALLSERWARGAADAVDAGADVVLVTGRPTEKELAETVSAAGERPCGAVIPQPSAQEAAQLRQSGLDFLVLAPEAPAGTLQDQQIAFLLQLKDDLTDIQLRTIDALPVDAIHLERDAAPLTIRRQMELQRISGLTRKPLLLSVRPSADQQDLLCLRDSGVALVALDLKERDAPDALRQLRGVIDALPARARQREREERAGVVLPRVASSEGADEGAGDEEGAATERSV